MYLKLLILSTVLGNLSTALNSNSTVPEEENYLTLLSQGIDNKEEWALKMLDASSKLPSGVMSGNLVELGAFDQCVSIDHKGIIKGKYCLVKLPLPFQQVRKARVLLDPSGSPGILLGWCIPDKISIKDITKSVNLILQILEIPVNVTTIDMISCQTKESTNSVITAGDWCVIAFLILILLLMILSTIYDIYMHRTNKEPAHLLLIAFSVKSNGQKLLAISKNPAQLPCVHGIRFISMAWVVLGHQYAASIMSPVANLAYVLNWVNNTSSMYILMAPVSVDTFFVLSGLLVAYGFLLAKEKGVRFNISMYYLHRYIRLTPALAVVVLIHATILNHLGSGPFWPFVIKILKDFCAENWWSALLYTQNYVNKEEMCIGQTWYLSVDTQLFVLSPIILIPLWRWPRFTISSSIVLILGSMGSSFGLTWYYKLPGLSIDANNDPNYNTKYYYATHTRFGPWLMGIILGYYIYKLKKNKNVTTKLHPLIVCLGWLVSLGILSAVVFAPHNLREHKYDRLEMSFFNGFHRHAWALAICWIIYACTQGYGGLINDFLSWSVFQVLGRFTYTMYLIHLSLQFLWAAKSRTSIYFSDINSIHRFWGDFWFTLILSVCLTLSFESPMLVIEKVIFGFGNKRKHSVLPTHQTTASVDTITHKR